MDATARLIVLTILCASVGGAMGTCSHVANKDVLEYSCKGGQLADLNNLPKETGKIRIMNMPISRITANTFAKFGSNLWVLSCSQCGIVDIEPGAFKHLDNLEQLSLDGNYLTIVKKSWFEGLKYLTYLDLNYNRIRAIEDGVFESLPSLIDLRLSGNQLECLNLEDLSHVKELNRIFLGENSEFKCPNAVSNFLESRGVSFERDPEWSKIPNDLVPVEVPFESDTQHRGIISTQSSWIPTNRERLYTVQTTVLPEQPRTSYVPSMVYSVKETVVYPPEYFTPDGRTTSQLTPSTPSYVERYPVKPTTLRSSYEDTSTSYMPSRIPPIDTMTYPPYVTTHGNLDMTTIRSWLSAPESGATIDSKPAFYPPHENENKHYEQTAYPSEVTRSPSLASSPIDHQETSVFVEPNVDHTVNPYKAYWIPNNNEAFSGMRYPPNEAAEDLTSASEVPNRESTHIVRPLPAVGPEMIQPASPGDLFQAPYNEPTVTIRPPPLRTYEQQHEETTFNVLSIEETTTDKPLPECPNRNSSSSIVQSYHLIIISVLLVVMKNIVVMGF